MINGMIYSYLKERAQRPAPTITFIIVLFVLINLFPVHADIIFPARIEIKEITSGEFDVVFILPVINNRKLNAGLVLPSVCRDITEHQVKSTYTSYIETWKIACKPEQLFGESIQIKGMLGTYIEVMLVIEMLNGRKYSTTLKPSKADFLIPYPPSFFSLLAKSSYTGIRQILLRSEIYLLLFLLVFFITQRRSLILGLAGFLISHLIAQYLIQKQLLILSPYLPSFLVLIIVLFPAFDLLQGKPALRRWFQPLWLLAIILGFLGAGIIQSAANIQGLSQNEQNIITIGYNIGIMIGLLLGYFLIKEFKQLLTMFILRTRPQKAHMILGYSVGVFACALIFYQSTVLIFVPSVLPDISIELLIFPLLFGFWLWKVDSVRSFQAVALFILFLVLGLTSASFDISVPLGLFLLLSAILFFAAQLVYTWVLPKSINMLIAVTAVFSYGWTTAQFISENLTLPIANTVGFSGIAVFIFFIGTSFISENRDKKNIPGLRVFAGGAALVVILYRIMEYKALFNREIATNLAMGLLTIPLLSLILFVGALFFWPRKRKVHRHLDIAKQIPIKQWTAIFLAFLLLPFGQLIINNPFFEPHAPEGNEARLVLQQVLSNTYHAFNIEDEDQSYQKLSASVSGDLVANIYLDSRRRLTAGVRQGGEVIVRDVSVLTVGDLLEGTNPNEGFTYESKWTVTARVKHLQHIHHRKNIYSGILKIKVEDNQWKISNIELKSEDRVIVPGSTG
jgi:hypothetical protein